MKVILIDDEVANLKNLQSLLGTHCSQVKVVGLAQSIKQGVELINLHQPDLVFLDIQMGAQTGFDLLGQLSEQLFEVIFVTAYDWYGVQAIKFAALDYLLKPVNIEELVSAVDKASHKVKFKLQNEQLSFLLHQLKQPATTLSHKIALSQQNEIRYVEISDIERCEATNNYTYFFLANGDKLLISNSLKEYADMLKPYGFLRTHQTHLVNPSFVKSWLKEDGGALLMKNGSKIPISRPNREIVRMALST